MTLGQKKVVLIVVDTDSVRMGVIIKKTLWHTVVMCIIVLNLVAVHTDMIMPEVNTAKHIMFITTMIKNKG